ncbi:MAG: RecQ family ATP-dependent DNA helicase, partial [Dysgonamonadaceae bacterium]|nr:RecQ family ATP-dependent DNA helicase [Dysgonamonadaceae bacterium]
FHQVLKQYWGYDRFRSLQEEIISSVYEGKDTLGLMPTGGGKSLTFQVPAMIMDGICIVVTPLIALMKDQVDNLKHRGIKATAVYSGMSRQEMIIALENCIFGNYKFLYVSPERLATELFLTKLQYMKVCMLVIDESHCISQWGYDFRPSYLRIADLREHLPEIPVLALTATATPEVVDDIQNKLHFKQKNVFCKSFKRENIAYIIRKTEDKIPEIIRILKKIPGTGLVYVRSRKYTKEIATELINQGINADFFHAGLNPDEKIEKQNRWKSGECRIMVCTNAFGMGIDKPDVRVVIHYELPGSLEEYFQEAGRAGRDEQKAYAIALYSEKDGGKLKKRVEDEFPPRETIKDIYEKLAFYFQIGINSGFQTTHNFNPEHFCTVFKFSFSQARQALKLLELSGYIEYLEETEKQSRVIFTIARDEMYKYSTFNETVENLIRVLLRSYTGLFSEYVYIKEDQLASRTGLSHHQVYDILKMLSSQHIIHYIPAQASPTITYSQNREDRKYLSIPQAVYEDRKNRLKSRIESVINYADADRFCRSRLLLEYFGEKKSNNCGQCDVCIAAKKKEPNSIDFDKISKEILNLITITGHLSIEDIISRLEFDEKSVIDVVRYLSDNKKVKLKGTIIYSTH